MKNEMFKRKEKGMNGMRLTHLGKRSILIAFWDKRGLLRPPGLLQSLVPLNKAL